MSNPKFEARNSIFTFLQVVKFVNPIFWESCHISGNKLHTDFKFMWQIGIVNGLKAIAKYHTLTVT